MNRILSSGALLAILAAATLKPAALTGQEPFDRDGWREMLTFYLTNYRQTSFDVEPAAIHVHGDIAIAHLHYDEVFTD
ncbi:MAG: hypothetical protein ACYSUI_10970 [Planctomycetota bacterium]|jgi:hypothetical protein